MVHRPENICRKRIKHTKYYLLNLKFFVFQRDDRSVLLNQLKIFKHLYAKGIAIEFIAVYGIKYKKIQRNEV